MTGYCSLHNLGYTITEPDTVCPYCLKAKEQDLEWRTEEENEDEA